MVEIRELKPDSLVNRVVTFEYESGLYYDVTVEKTLTGWEIMLTLREFDKPFVRRFEERLIEDYKTDPRIFAAFVDDEEAGLALIGRLWEGSYRVWDFYVWQEHKRRGIGRALMKQIEDTARSENSRRIVLETQSSNYPAISFYLSCGFQLCGFDTSCYSNQDIENKEVRLEFHKLLK
ncbi:MAG TPA: N-acetyltransferase [Kosmotogaceae bacterium]|nr:MAG: GCN5-related N-acetyltransferase [Thermotogales bacterium 46_20]HAA84950.1 N-acetyltransferase [Kosmotogaceae bacterium]